MRPLLVFDTDNCSQTLSTSLKTSWSNFRRRLHKLCKTSTFTYLYLIYVVVPELRNISERYIPQKATSNHAGLYEYESEIYIPKLAKANIFLCTRFKTNEKKKTSLLK